MDHSQMVRYLAESLPVREVYIELGVQTGSTFLAVAPLFQKAIGVDINDCPIRESGEFHQMDTQEFFRTHEPVVADMIFVDANHDHEAVLADAHMALKWLRPWQGLMVLHDTYPDNAGQLSPRFSGDAWHAAALIQGTWPEVEVLTLPNLHGLTLVRSIPNYQYIHWAGNEELLRLSDEARG